MLSCIIAVFLVVVMSSFSKDSWAKVDIELQNTSDFELSNLYQNTIAEDFVISNFEKQSVKEDIWCIEIPKINLNAEISEGTSAEILNKFVGHFEDTEIWNGNVCLAAHNRGYDVNYFEKLKELETGDEIFYEYKGNRRKYIVKIRDIIKETDWSYLEQYQDNRLTLITCVEDMPEYRRCIQAVEKKEE